VTSTELEVTKSLPDRAELMQLEQNAKTMTVFCDHFLSYVVGKVEWECQVTKKQIKDFANLTDDAFANMDQNGCCRVLSSKTKRHGGKR